MPNPTAVQETSQPLRGQMFRGMNAFLPAERLPASDVQLADNMWVIAGELWTRPGKQGMFARPLAGPIYALTAYAASNGAPQPVITTWLMFVSSAKLYMAQAGASDDPTEIKIGGTAGTSFTLNSATARMIRVGAYMYIVDGVGPLYKVKIPYINGPTAYTAVVYTGLNAPTTAFTASLTNQVIDTMSDVTKWSSFPALSWPTGAVSSSTYETITNTNNRQFTGGTASPSPYPTGWLGGGDSVGYQASSVGGQEIYGDAGLGPSWADWCYPTPTYAAGTNTIGNARVFAASASGHCGQGNGVFGMQVFPTDHSVLSTTQVNITDLVIVSGAGGTVSSAGHPFQSADVNKVLTIFSSTGGFTAGNYTITSVNAGTHVATLNGNPGTNGSTSGKATMSLDSGGASGNLNSTLDPPPSGVTGADQTSGPYTCPPDGKVFTNVFSFTGLAQDFDSLIYRLITPAAQPNAVGINTPSFRAVDVRLLLQTSSSGTIHLKANNPLGVGYNCLGGCWIKRDYTGSPGGYIDYSQSNTISVKYSAPTTSGKIPFRFGFLKTGLSMGTDGANIVWSNPVNYTEDGSAFYCDCSTIDPTVRAQTAYLFIQVINDLATTINPADLCTIGPISTSGNLTLHELYGGYGGDYSYQWTKMNAANDSTYFVDVVESDPSPMSKPPAQPNGVSNQVGFTLPTSGSFADGTTHLCIYRFGGVFDDGLGRLIARVSLSADQAADAQHQFTWVHTTGAFVDNTTDSSLEVNIPTFLLSGRTPLPNGATCITEWDGHIIAAIGSSLYISWAIPSGNNTGLYFNTVNVDDPNDIAQSVKGKFFDTGGADNDPVQNLTPLGPYVIVWKQRSIFLVTGRDAASFDLLPHTLRGGLGLTAPLASAVVGFGAWFLAADGVYAYDGTNDPQTTSTDIRPLLNPGSRNLPASQRLNPVAYANSFMAWHGQRLYLCAPASPDDMMPSVLYVYDQESVGAGGETGGWVRWTDMRFTSAASLTQSSNTDDLYFAGQDGQIYSMSGYGDKATSTSAPQPITINLLSRKLGQQTISTFGAEILGPDYFNVAIPEFLQMNVVTQENVTLHVSVWAANTDRTWTQDYQANTTQVCLRQPVDSAVQGVNCWVGLTASSYTPIVVKRLALELGVGAPES